METIFKESIYKIIRTIYNERNIPVHLRDIARKSNLNESTISKRLNEIEKYLNIAREANLKKFSLKKEYLKLIFPFIDNDKLNSLPILRKTAIKELKKLNPTMMIVFGSTANNTFKKKSDLDIVMIFSEKKNISKDVSRISKMTTINIQIFQYTEDNLLKDIEADYVLGSAINSGFPVVGYERYYDELYQKTGGYKGN